jgi:uncharacterized protein (TIGR03435 family)
MFSGGPGTSDPGMISWSRATLHDLLYHAYDLQDSEQISEPQWLSAEYYDIAAKIPSGTTKAQFQTMLQSLLVERFKVELHHVKKDFPVYYLVVGRNGPKLKEPGSDTNREGFPPIAPGKPGMSVTYTGMQAHLTARQQTLAALGGMLRPTAGRQILDKTGLPGKFDYTLEFTVRDLAEAGPLPSLFDALPQQLGLRLEDGKAPFDVLVIDHAEKVPTGN